MCIQSAAAGGCPTWDQSPAEWTRTVAVAVDHLVASSGPCSSLEMRAAAADLHQLNTARACRPSSTSETMGSGHVEVVYVVIKSQIEIEIAVASVVALGGTLVLLGVPWGVAVLGAMLVVAIALVVTSGRQGVFAASAFAQATRSMVGSGPRRIDLPPRLCIDSREGRSPASSHPPCACRARRRKAYEAPPVRRSGCCPTLHQSRKMSDAPCGYTRATFARGSRQSTLL